MSQPAKGNKIPKSLIKWVVICIMIYGAWNIAFPSGSWRYKLTVQVETPEGIKTGSAVREVHGQYTGRFLGATAGRSINLAKGEAVVVDLGKRGVLFALNSTYDHGSDGGHVIVEEAFPLPYSSNRDRTMVVYYSGLEPSAPVVLSPEQYPVMVRFRDPDDPKTVEAVKPGQHFSEAFGEGVELKSVTIEMTNEPVTKGEVEKYLDWLPHYYGKKLDGNRYNTIKAQLKFANTLSSGSFSTELSPYE